MDGVNGQQQLMPSTSCNTCREDVEYYQPETGEAVEGEKR
jgi:hypothetical protein